MTAMLAVLRSNGFRPCETCGGAGFLRVGGFASRTFPRCEACGGCGQVYIDPPPPPPPNREATGYDCGGFGCGHQPCICDLVEF